MHLSSLLISSFLQLRREIWLRVMTALQEEIVWVVLGG